MDISERCSRKRNRVPGCTTLWLLARSRFKRDAILAHSLYSLQGNRLRRFRGTGCYIVNGLPRENMKKQATRYICIYISSTTDRIINIVLWVWVEIMTYLTNKSYKNIQYFYMFTYWFWINNITINKIRYKNFAVPLYNTIIFK